VLLAFAAAALLLLAFPGALRLVNPDEPRDCEIGREWADGVWSVVPRLNGEPYWSKPPLFHWSVGLVMKATGSEEEWTAKVAAGLFGAAAVAATAAAGEAALGPGLGLLAGLLLLGTQFFFLRFRVATTDAALTAFTTLAMALFFVARKSGRLRWYLLMGAAAGLAAFAKALHGLLFPFLVGAILEFRAWRRLLLGFLVGAAVFGVWLLLLRTEGPLLVHEFLFGNMERRFGAEAHHAGAWYHYGVVVLRVLPWTLPCAAGAWAAFRGEPRLLGPFAWVAAMVLALSLATGKRSVYLLPVLPGAALLAAGAIDAAARGALSRWPDRLVRWTIEPLAFPVRWIPWFREGLLRRASGAALVCAVGLAAFAVLVVGPETEAESAAPFARRAAAAAGARPLVLYRLGQGYVGQFCFPLRRVIPVAKDLDDLRRIAGGKPVALLVTASAPRLPGCGTLLADGCVDERPYFVYLWEDPPVKPPR
jgi:4-amino-4-deoxy-L-arabinose transferase-like glycosyltransferase